VKPVEFLEEALAAEEVGNLKADQDVFEYPAWRVALWITSAWAAVLFVGWAVLFRSKTSVGFSALVVVAGMILSAVWGMRGLRRVRIVGARLIAEFGFGRPSRSWEIAQLSLRNNARGFLWNGQIQVILRDTGRTVFIFSPYLSGWKRLEAKILGAGGAA
jgi:hypothetical protein